GMEELVAQVEAADPGLDPPKDQFDQLVSQCRQLNSYLAGAEARPGQPHDHQEVARSIDTHSAQGERAYENKDQRSYADAIGMLEGIRRHLVRLYEDAVEGSDPRSETERVTEMVQSVAEEAGHVLRDAKAEERHDIREEVESIQRQLVELEHKA